MQSTTNHCLSSDRNDAIVFPYDFALDFEGIKNWQRRLWLPVPYPELRETTLQYMRRLIKGVAQVGAEDRRLAFLAALRVVGPWSVAVLESALIVARMRDVRFTTHIPEVRYVGGLTDSAPSATGLEQLFQPASCRRPFVRKILWTAQWSPVWRLGATLTNPDILVFNRNNALIRAARISQQKICYDNVEGYYSKIWKSVSESKISLWDKNDIRKLLDKAAEGFAIDESCRKRAIELITERFYIALNIISTQLNAIRDVRLPKQVWAGTGGYWPSRIVGLEIMRRGGIVRRFDHGYNSVFSRVIEEFILVEAAVSTHFVFTSEACAQRWRKEPIAELLPPPLLESLPPTSKPYRPTRVRAVRRSGKSTGPRPRVLYATGQLKGFWQALPSKLPNLVYLDWTLRATQLLQTMPIDLVYRPHPGGVLGGKQNPVSTIANVPETTFEELLETVDLVVTDTPFSRVLCVALCSMKPVVYLDLGHDYFCEALLPLFNQRCKIVRLSYDDRGLPQADRNVLVEAIFHAEPPDATVVERFRNLFANEY